VEEELIPLVRELNMSFWAYSPLAGGFLAKTAEYFRSPINKGRWDPKTEVGKLYNHLYNRPDLVDALDTWGQAAEVEGCSRAALAYRWVRHHSAVGKSTRGGGDGDAILMGASTVEQVRQTLGYLEDGPLGDEVLRIIEGVWEKVKGEAPFDNYHD
jgi:aflatoxin B1 aldehyde reductase